MKGKYPQMIIDIDTVNERSEICLVGEDCQMIRAQTIANKEAAEKILTTLADLCSANNLNLSDLLAVTVNLGPGSYTGQRIGVTTANLIAFSLCLPVVGYENGRKQEAFEKIKKSRIVKGFEPVSPLYAHPPAITQKR